MRGCHMTSPRGDGMVSVPPKAALEKRNAQIAECSREYRSGHRSGVIEGLGLALAVAIRVGDEATGFALIDEGMRFDPELFGAEQRLRNITTDERGRLTIRPKEKSDARDDEGPT